MTASTSAGTGTCTGTGTGTGTDTGTDTGTGTRDSENEREVHGEPSVNYCQIDVKKTLIDAQKPPVKPKHGGRKGKELLQQVPVHGRDEEQKEGSGDLPQVHACGTGNGSVSSNGIMEGGNEQVPEVSAHEIESRIVQSPQGQVVGSGEKEVAELSALGTESTHPPLGTVEGSGEREATKLPTHGTTSQIVQSSHGAVEGGREKKAPKVHAHGTASQGLPQLDIAARTKNKAPQVPAHKTRIVGVQQQGTTEAVPQDSTHEPVKGDQSGILIQLSKCEMDEGGVLQPAQELRREGDRTVLSAHGTEHKPSGVLLQDPTSAIIVKRKNGAPQVPAKPTRGREMPKEYKTKGGEISVYKVNQEVLQVLPNKVKAEKQEKSRATYPLHAGRAMRENQQRSKEVPSGYTGRTNQERSKEVSAGHTDKTNLEKNRGVSPARTDEASPERNRGVSPMSTDRPEGGSQGRGKGMSSVHTDRPIGTSQERGRGRRPAYGTEMRN